MQENYEQTHVAAEPAGIDGASYCILRIWKANVNGYECHSPTSLVVGTAVNFFKRARLQLGIVGHVSLELIKEGRTIEYISFYPMHWAPSYNRNEQKEDGEVGYKIAPDETIYLHSLNIDAMKQAFDRIKNNTSFHALALKYYDHSSLMQGENCASLTNKLLQIGGIDQLVQHHWIAFYTPNVISKIGKAAKIKECELYPQINAFYFEDERINPTSFVENMLNSFG